MSEMCAATLTWLFSIFLDPLNWDNAPWALSGAIGDRQHVGGFHGLNAILVDEAIRRSALVRRPGAALLGPTVGAALATSIDPYFRRLSGQHRPSTRSFGSSRSTPRLRPSHCPKRRATASLARCAPVWRRAACCPSS